MPAPYREYELQDGFVHNWLVVGPVETPVVVDPTGALNEHDRKLQIVQGRRTATPDITGDIVEREPASVDGEEIPWCYVRTLEDHFVDLSTFRHNWTYLRAWAYTRLSLFDAAEATFELTTNGPADVWINGEHVHRQEHFHHQDPATVTFAASLQEADNEVLIRLEEVAARECPYAMALKVTGVDAEDVEVRIPSATERTVHHMMLEESFDQAFIDEVANYRGKVINLRWADDLQTNFNYNYGVQGPGTRINVSGETEAKTDEINDIGHGYRIKQGPYRVVLRAVSSLYYEWQVRYQREMPLYILDFDYSETPYGTYEERNREALAYAASQEGDLYAEIAKMELGEWEDLDLAVIRQSMVSINTRGDCSDFYLVGLLGALYRYGDAPEFPEELKAPLKSCVLDFKYWHDEPGADAMCYTTENHSILFHACEILAGQLYPEETFSNAGQTGAWHRAKGERLALTWMRTRGRTGFWEWDSNCYFDEDLLALSHLTGLAESEDLSELAAVLMDKMLFTMAVNSYKGTFGSTHGRTYAQLVKSGRLEATSGIARLLWGQGVYNQHLRGLVAMACSEYEFPMLLANIATDQRDESWDRERHVVSDSGEEINKVTYKTPDYMLASVQDYRPGEKGYQQHIWQATFGPDAVVFVNHPPCVSEEGAHRPNFWSGNYVLPRVVQHKDVLVALHDLPDDDWLGFTHAHFPIHQFDDVEVNSDWAFARKGDGYLALYASSGLSLTKRGPGAYRELRAGGPQTAWVCQMGRAALDGDFASFKAKVLGTAIEVDGLSVRYQTLRGDDLAFAWNGPLTRNGAVEPTSGFRHYENPYCVTDLEAEQMDIGIGQTLMRLQF